jgi:hypothetical protein
VLDGKSSESFNCPIFRQLAIFRAEQCSRLRAEMPDEQREGLAHPIVYPAKANPTGAFKKKDRRLVAT